MEQLIFYHFDITVFFSRFLLCLRIFFISVIEPKFNIAWLWYRHVIENE